MGTHHALADGEQVGDVIADALECEEAALGDELLADAAVDGEVDGRLGGVLEREVVLRRAEQRDERLEREASEWACL